MYGKKMLPTIGKWYTKTTAKGYKTERKIIRIRDDAIYGDVVIYNQISCGRPQYSRVCESTVEAWRRWAKDATESDERLT